MLIRACSNINKINENYFEHAALHEPNLSLDYLLV
jgi:hypothetical protein